MVEEFGFGDIPPSPLDIISNGTPGPDGPIPKLPSEILEEIVTSAKWWPRRVGDCLIVPDSKDNTRVDIWDRNACTRFFSWLGATFGGVQWYTGRGFYRREDFYEYTLKNVVRHDSIELAPHYPRFDERNPPVYYYACPSEAWDYERSEGSRLTELLQMFNPATLEDYHLLKAMFLTLLWGGTPGERPIFVITSDSGSGSGKSTIAYVAAKLVCGYMDMQPDEDLTALKNRLLSPVGRSKRVAILDNVSAVKFRWSLLESSVTQPEVTGKQMYTGESTRPNTLIWIMTLNGISLGRDLSQRAVIIKVNKPKYSSDWKTRLRVLLKEHKIEIWQDIQKILALKSYPMGEESRWADWERGVLSKIPHPEKLMPLIIERQSGADDDEEESGLIREAFVVNLEKVGLDVDVAHVRLRKSLVSQWIGAALGRKLTTIAATRKITTHIQSGYLPEVSEAPSRTHGRNFLWRGRKTLDEKPTTLEPYVFEGESLH